MKTVRSKGTTTGAYGVPSLTSMHPAAARWIGALIRMTSSHPAMTRILNVVEGLQDRPFRTNALLLGEPGTGKEGLARALHHLMAPGTPLVRVDLVGYSDEEALAVLSGEGKGAHAAAEIGDGAMLLIEEAAGLSLRVQTALLRLLKTGGDTRSAEPGRAPKALRAVPGQRHRDVGSRSRRRGRGRALSPRPLLRARAHRAGSAAAARAHAGPGSRRGLDRQPRAAQRRPRLRADDRRGVRARVHATTAPWRSSCAPTRSRRCSGTPGREISGSSRRCWSAR